MNCKVSGGRHYLGLVSCLDNYHFPPSGTSAASAGQQVIVSGMDPSLMQELDQHHFDSIFESGRVRHMRREEGLAGRTLRESVEVQDNGLGVHGAGVVAADTAETAPGCHLI